MFILSALTPVLVRRPVFHRSRSEFWCIQFSSPRGGNMCNMARAVSLGILVLVSAIASLGQSSISKDTRGSLVMVFKDGHRQTFPVADIAKIEFKAADIVVFKDGRQQSFPLTDVQSFEFDTTATKPSLPGRNHFVGKWKVGQG